MRSGNGRHRRPRQAPALIVAAGVTGSAIAIPLLGASGASAAEASTWDRVADCESGGMWSADLGNGYYGGLQIAQETWTDFGGTAYAPTADQASRSQQIAVAERILAEQGPAAWPTCALITGLAADAGTTPDSEPSEGSSEETAQAAEAEDTAPGEEAELPAAPEEVPPYGQFGRDSALGTDEPAEEPSVRPSTEAATGTGKHRGAPAPEADASTGPGASAGTDPDAGVDAGDADESLEAGASGASGAERASRDEGSAREGAAAEGRGAEGGAYTVRSGDSLWTIADEQKVDGGWSALYAANREVVGSDADLILPGQSLDLALEQG